MFELGGRILNYNRRLFRSIVYLTHPLCCAFLIVFGVGIAIIDRYSELGNVMVCAGLVLLVPYLITILGTLVSFIITMWRKRQS